MKIRNWTAMALTTLTVFANGCSAAPVNANGKEDKNMNGKIYVYESDANGFNTKNFFYDNGEEVVAFDTQFTPETAEKSIAFLRTQTSNPITAVVISHPNPDKFNGMSVFQKLGAKVISSKKTADNMPGVHEYKKYYFVNVAKMFTDATYPKLSTVDVTFDQTYDLRLKNGEVITLTELSQPGVSTNQTVALIPSAHAAIVGDLVHHGVHSWLEGGIVNGKPTPTLPGWIADLAELQSLLKDAPETVVYGGRGDAVQVGDAVKTQTAYLQQADTLVSKYVQGLEKAAPDYVALQAQFEKAFPTYGLGYMIQYGAYGLVNSKM